MSLQNNFPDLEEEFEGVRRVMQKLPDKVGQTAQDISMDSFEAEQFQDSGTNKWAPRKRDKEAGKPRGRRRGLLVQSGELRRSLDYETTPGEVRYGTDVIYAQRHNEGLAGMPQRQFMGDSAEMDTRVERWMDNEMDKIFE